MSDDRKSTTDIEKALTSALKHEQTQNEQLRERVLELETENKTKH